MTQSGPNQTLPAPPAPPSVVKGAPAPNVVTPGMLTSRDVDVMRQRSQELKAQLDVAVERRNSAQRSLQKATTQADRAGIEKRLSVLDDRIARIETDIAENGRLLSSVEAQRASSAPPFPPFQGNSRNNMGNNVVPIAIVFTIFVLSPIALSISRFFWRRGSIPRQSPAVADQSERLQRMEQAIDSIAIEMERVSEGQRFVTRILAEGRQANGLAAGAGQAVPLPVGDQLGARR